MSDTMEIIYSEKAPHYPLLVTAFNLLALAFVLIFANLAWNQNEGWLAFFIAAPLMTWGALSFSNMRYELDEEAVTAWLWPLRSRIEYKDVEKIEILEKYPWYVGLGMHWFKGTWWVTTRYQPCVLIHQKGKSNLAFTPTNPDAFVAMLKEHIKKAKHKKAR
ncbi:hypothetical protein GOV07_03375 [Candidatus Woesearchaeota archaeon]|nr:hypothetical protein [Candidatus Woesearchaeota archaeon]